MKEPRTAPPSLTIKQKLDAAEVSTVRCKVEWRHAGDAGGIDISLSIKQKLDALEVPIV